MKKKAVLFLAAAALSVTLVGCGSENDKKESKSTKAEVTTEVTTTEKKEVNLNIDQMAKPKKGETIAIMKVKGYGEMKMHFFEKAAPKAVENFVKHSKDGYYNGLKFHRVINDFMIQGGDPDGTGMGGESIWGGTFEDECTDQLKVLRGALCMANSGAGTSTNGSQFFIVQKKTVEDNLFTGTESDEMVAQYKKYGGCPWLQGQHTVFGQVYEGLDVLDKIAAVSVDQENAMPVKDVVIEKITITKAK